MSDSRFAGFFIRCLLILGIVPFCVGDPARECLGQPPPIQIPDSRAGDSDFETSEKSTTEAKSIDGRKNTTAEKQDDQKSSNENEELAAPKKRVKTPVKTADEYLQRLVGPDSNHYSFMNVELSPDEINTVVDALREQYKFDSLRKRIEKLNRPRTSAADDEKRLEAEATVPSTRNKWKRHSPRVEALKELHSKEAEQFIRRGGAGLGRMIVPSPFELKLPERYATRIQSQNVGSDLLAEAAVDLPKNPSVARPISRRDAKFSLAANGLPTSQLASYFHDETANGFASPDSMGFVKSKDQVAGFESHRIRFGTPWDGSMKIWKKDRLSKIKNIQGLETDWKANRLELVSLMLHQTPQVYQTDELPDMEALSGADAPTRELNAFERESLGKLSDGEDVVTAATMNRLVMLGALRANQSCLQCHSEKKEGDLLGAFSYEFLRHPRVEIPVNGKIF